MSAGDDSRRRPLPSDLGRLLHDLRGPLNSLTMHLEVLRRSAGEAPVAESVRTMQEQLARLGAMLPSAFAIAALELGACAPVDLRAVAVAASESAGGPVTLAPGGAWPTVRGDAALLTQALTHLMRNAVEASAAAGHAQPVEVKASEAGDEVRVAVRDRGPGLRTTNSNLLIKLMHSTKPGHAGVGLLTVERIARLHGGTVRFETPGDGAIVTLALRR